MPLPESVLGAITKAVFSFLLQQGKVSDQIRRALGRDPVQRAFQRSLSKACEALERQHPDWVANSFDSSFFEHEGASLLAQFLVRDGHPDPSELAARWATTLYLSDPERHTVLTRKLEPVAADFLETLAHALQGEKALDELNNHRTWDQVATDIALIRGQLGAGKATRGTRLDYLYWLIERHSYLDPRGTLQTPRQVQVKLENVYISLRAQASFRTEKVAEGRQQRFPRYKKLYTGATQRLSDGSLELTEAVHRHTHLVILGDPGSGKTTLLRYLALQHAQALWRGQLEAGEGLGTACFPILIRIADYAENTTWKEKPLSDFLADYCLMHECPGAGLADLLSTALATGPCLVLLDGLDEVVDADDRRGIVQRIEDFRRRHDDHANRFVLTSRTEGYRNTPLAAPFVDYTMQEMDELQIRRFLERWCLAVETTETPDLSLEMRQAAAQREIDGIMQAVHTTSGVRRLAANPLLLRTLALIHRTGAQLPQKRIELYKLAADTLARTWRTAQGVPESALVSESYLTRLLRELAYWLHVHKPTGIMTEREVFQVLGHEWARIKGLAWSDDDPHPDILADVSKFLLAVREHTGLFVERSPNRYGFMHLTFEEYYAARHLAGLRRHAAQRLRQHLHDPRWDEPILLALGFYGLDSPDEAEELLEAAILAEGEEAHELGLTPSPYEDMLGRDYLFALRCLGDRIPMRAQLRQRLVRRLARELLYREGSAQYDRYYRALQESLPHLG